MKISQVAEIIRTETGFKGEVRYNTNRFVGARRRVLSTELVRRETNWQPRVGLEEGIRRTVAGVRAALG